MSSTRRDFLKIGSMATASLLVPKLMSSSNVFGSRKNAKSVVVIQLTGGNDGLNTVVPFRNDIYYRNRPRLAIRPTEVLSLNDELGFHPSLKGLHSLFGDGDLTVLNSVGYPNSNRSHFRSMDIWHTASKENEYLNTGWIGRMMDLQQSPIPYHALEVDDTLTLALKGLKMKGLALKDPARLHNQIQQPFLRATANSAVHNHGHDEVGYLRKTLAETAESVDYVYDKSKIYSSNVTYPQTQLGKGLKTIAELIVAECNTMVYYVSLGGFDTHVGQDAKHKNVLRKYDESVSAFVKDLKKNKKFDDVLILTFSEFGRRVAQNASGGTDHGAASNVFLMSGSLNKPGIYNKASDLNNLDAGDIKHTLDFRNIYGTILENWLEQPSKEILGQWFPPLPLV